MESIIKMILEFILDFSNIGNLCSIAGFLITILTLIFTINVKKAVNIANKEILFKHLSGGEIKKLKESNSLFLNSVDSLNKQKIRDDLNSLKTKLDFLKSHSPQTIPTKQAIKQIKFLYKSNYLTEEETKRICYKYEFIRKLTYNANNDDFYEAYRRITTVIDRTEQIQKSKKILS